MAEAQLADLLEGQVLQSGLMAVVTSDRVVVRDLLRQSNTVISLGELSRVKRIRTSYPALLVISSGCYLIAAACFYSKEGSSATIPFALLGIAFTVGYILSRRACVAFCVGDEVIETANGSLAEATALIRAVHKAQKQLTSSAI